MTALQLMRALADAVAENGGRDIADVMATGPYGPTEGIYRELIAVESAEDEVRLIVV